MSETTSPGPRQAKRGAATKDGDIRPFQVSVPDEDLAELPQQPVLE
jgi:hypothetical protein